VDIPVLELPDFLENAKNPIAQYNYPEFNVNLISSLINLKKLFEYLSGNNPALREHGYVNFVADMQNAENLLTVHKHITSGNFYISYDIFNELMKLDIPEIDKGTISFEDFSGRIKHVYPAYKNMNDSILAEAVIKKYPIYKNKVTFNNLSSLMQHEKQNDNDDNKVKGLQLFYTDRINIGKIEIVLPVPSEFVRVDDMHQNQFDIAKLFVPETNSLLAYYLGEKDFADLVTTGSHTADKYIMVQIFNELKYQQVKSIAFQKYLRKFKNDYKIEFQESFKNGSFEAIQNIPESVKGAFDLNKIDAYPLGIYHDGKNSVSIGVLSKMNYSYNGESQEDILVAAISSIVNINGKIVFLYLYKTYKYSSDLDWLRRTNDAWIKEIEKRQSPTHFFSEFDFKQFREIVMAILFLGFLWGGYFATKKILKYRRENKTDKPITENKTVMKNEEFNHAREEVQTNEDDFIDFDELLKPNQEITANKTFNLQSNDEAIDIPGNQSVDEDNLFIADPHEQWKVARTGLIIFGVIHFVLEIAAETKVPILPVIVNYFISVQYIKSKIRSKKIKSHPYVIAFTTSIVVFLIRILLGVFLYLLGYGLLT
jgi:hypothetical protein